MLDKIKILFIALLFVVIPFLSVLSQIAEQVVKITAIKTLQTQQPNTQNKLTQSISFNGITKLQPGTILHHRLLLERETLKGDIEYFIAERFSQVTAQDETPTPSLPNGGQGFLVFSENLPINKILPPSKYLLITTPSDRQKKKELIIPEKERQRISDKYYFWIGTYKGRIIFLLEEQDTLAKYINTAENIYSNIETLFASSAKNQLPADDETFRDWLADKQQKIRTLAIISQNDYFTCYPLTCDEIRNICNRLSTNLESIERTVRYKGQTPVDADPVSPVLSIDGRAKAIIENETMRELFTKEAIFNLSSFVKSMADDSSQFFASVNQIEKLNRWELQQGLWYDGLNEYDRFISELKPADKNIWKKYAAKLGEQKNLVMKLLESYNLLIKQEDNQEAAKKIKIVKDKIMDIFNQIYEELKL